MLKLQNLPLRKTAYNIYTNSMENGNEKKTFQLVEEGKKRKKKQGVKQDNSQNK